MDGVRGVKITNSIKSVISLSLMKVTHVLCPVFYRKIRADVRNDNNPSLI